MRVAMLILGVLGGLSAGALGLKWLNDIGQLSEMDRMVALAMGRGKELDNLGTAGLLLVGSCIAGILGGVFAFKQKYALGSVLMLSAGILPLFYASRAILFTALLIAGGAVALAAQMKTGKAAPAN